MTKISFGWFIAALVMVGGPLVAAAPSWGWFATPAGAGAALVALGGVLGAAFGVNGSGFVARITGNGSQPVPKDVN